MSWRERKNKKASGVTGVVASVQEQTRQATELAQIAGQARLLDPRLNPAVRERADRLRNDQQRRKLDAEHARDLRRLRVADSRAADAEETLQAIQLAKQASSPARSVLALHRGKRRYLRLTMAASVALSAGSAMGVEAAASQLGAPTGTGYVAEIGLTGLATAVVLYISHLTEHGGRLDRDTWQGKVLIALMVVPLLVSVAANLGTVNIIGALCAVGAVSFSALSYIVAEQSSTVMQERAAEVTDTDADELHRTAMGDELLTTVVAEPHTDHDGGGLEQGVGQYLVMVGPEPTDDDGQEELRALPSGEAERSDDGQDATENTAEDEGDFPVLAEDGERLNPEVLSTVTDTVVAVEVPEGLADLERFLADQDPPAGEGAGSSAPPEPGDSGPHGAARTAPDHLDALLDDRIDVDQAWEELQGKSDKPAIRPGGQIDGDQADRRSGFEGSDRVLPAIQARRAAGASTRQRVAEYWTTHPDATVAQMVTALELSETTVKRYRREIRAARTVRDQRRGGEQS
jgi:hypothetical protein